MTDDEIEFAALSDPDALPLTDERLAGMRRVPRVKTLRRALDLTQDEFANRYDIPLGVLRDWEQGLGEPEAAANAYFKIIAKAPAGNLQGVLNKITD